MHINIQFSIDFSILQKLECPFPIPNSLFVNRDCVMVNGDVFVTNDNRNLRIIIMDSDDDGDQRNNGSDSNTIHSNCKWNDKDNKINI